ncbi:hypothetical protein [Winogradskyella poriferorum]|uniref:DUF3426 domain-containing protein n=1 Tax=Winogradskyella poriferorum TaxID=307627 RepID=A0ABU7W6G0_9FLAO
MGKKKEKKKKSKVEFNDRESFKQQKPSKLPLYLSILAILISFGQLVFTVPIVLKYFDRVEIEAKELGIAKPINEDFIKSSFIIRNTGNNTAENVELHLRILDDDNVVFIPDVFRLVKDDNRDGITKNLIYKCDELVPGEHVRISVFSNFVDYLKINNIDTLYFNKPIKRPEFNFGPYISGLKHSLNKVKVEEKDSLYLKEIRYLNQ